MPRKQTSNSVSAIAGKYAKLTNEQFWAVLLAGLDPVSGRWDSREFFGDVRKVCAAWLASEKPKSKQEKPIRKRPSVDV